MRYVRIPSVLHELHGERARLGGLVATYAVAAAVATIVSLGLARVELVPLVRAAVFVLFLDLGGGVVATFTTSTGRYYQARKRLRLPFLLLHMVHPVLLALLVPASRGYFLAVGAYTVAAGLAANAVRDPERQQVLAAALFAVGVAASLLLPVAAPIVYGFAPLFAAKILLGFAVRRLPLDGSAPSA